MSLRVLLKRLQRQLYTLLLHPLGCFASVVVVALLAAWTFAAVLGGSFAPVQQPLPTKGVWIDFADNIGGVDMQHHLAYGPIDVVYTWVNGSDPRWLKKKKLWEERMFGPQLPVPETNDTGNATQIDDSRSANRYRDSQELRYSLRSLIKYAPWIRKIYLVTDNQIPHWLNLDADRLHVVSHEEIFPNKSHLPVFSSPAIETHLHRLPGLSDKFIYFNDDVMLGAPTFPEDFVSTAGTQKVYLSWEVPKCAPGCSEGWIGDGYCDRACNVSECNFDFPDCVNTTDSSGRFRNGGGGDNRKQSTVQCSKGCPDSWLGDRVCDNRCAKEECAFDVGDCGINAFADKLPGVTIGRDNAFIVTKKAGAQENKDQLREFVNTVPAFAGDPPVAMSVPAGTTAAYFNLSQVFPASANVTFEKAIFANAELVHNAIFIKMHRILVVLFYHGQEGAPPPPPLPTHAVFTLAATEGNYTTTAIFRAVMLPKHVVDATVEIPEQMGLVEGFVSTCNRISVPETTEVEMYDKFLSTIPFRSSSRASTDEGIALHVRLRGPRFAPRLPARNVVVRSTVTFPGNASSVVLHYPLAVVAGTKSQHSNMGLTVKDLSRDFELPEPDDREALQKWQMVTPLEDRLGRFQAELRQAAVNDTIDLRLALPIPKTWAEMDDKVWIHHQVELLVHPNEGPDQDSYTATCLVAMHSWGTAREPEPEQSKASSEPESVLPNLGFTTQSLSNNNTSSTSDHNVEVRADRRRLLQQADDQAQYPIRILDDDDGDHARLVHDFVSDRRSPRRLRVEMPLSEVNELLHAEQEYLQTRALLPTTVQVPSSDEAGLLAADNWWMRVLQQVTLQQEVMQLTPPQPPRDQPYGQQRRRSRRLQDTYAKSLVHVNRLYTKAFGVEQRKVPAHMPHMIDKHIMSEMQERWKDEWEATSTHRFRSPNDMQYAFAYFFYVMNRNKLIELNVVDYLSTEVDTNHDGIVDKNEQRTLAALMTKEVITQQDLDALEFCIAPPHLQAEARENRTVLADYPATITDAANCTLVKDAIQKHARRPPTHEVGPAEEVSFEMIGDDFNHSITQLDSIRHRRTKFICVNDDMKKPSPELLKAFSDFYEALFPLPCQFELPKGQANPTLYLDEYRALTANTAASASTPAFAINDMLSVLTNNRRAIAFGLCVMALMAFVALKQRRSKDEGDNGDTTQQQQQQRHDREEQRSPRSAKSEQQHQPATRRPTARKSASKH